MLHRGGGSTSLAGMAQKQQPLEGAHFRGQVHIGPWQTEAGPKQASRTKKMGQSFLPSSIKEMPGSSTSWLVLEEVLLNMTGSHLVLY